MSPVGLPTNDVTRFLSAAEQGDPQAAERLLPLVYDELRKLAAQRLVQERPGQTFQATALVHEAYLRLVGTEPEGGWTGRGHFFAAAAEAMRRMLVEQARRKGRIRHGGGLRRVDLLDANAAALTEDEQVLLLDEALTRLAAARPQAAELVKLRFFAGLTLEGIAPLLALTAPSTSPYVLSVANSAVNGANGLPVIGTSKAVSLTIIGNGDTIERNAAAGTAAFRLLEIAGGSSLLLEYVTLQNGVAQGSGAAADGGAIDNQGSLTLIGGIVQNNAAEGTNGADGLVTENKSQGGSIVGQTGGRRRGGHLVERFAEPGRGHCHPGKPGRWRTGGRGRCVGEHRWGIHSGKRRRGGRWVRRRRL